jgi:ribosomal protein S18 acetylase RimI-like enzyme
MSNVAVMQVVHATLEDARSVAEIHVNTWRSAYASILPTEYLASLSVDRREKLWSECITAGMPELLVAKTNKLALGWLSFGPCRDQAAPASEAEVWALYASPSSWSTGVGRMLWLRARELMLAQGFRSCSLWVFPQNDRAITFYRAAGFVPDGTEPKTFELGGTQLQELRFVAQLHG